MPDARPAALPVPKLTMEARPVRAGLEYRAM